MARTDAEKKADQEATKAKMDTAKAEALIVFNKLMKSGEATAVDLIAFHQEWYLKAGHKRLGQIYRDHHDV